MAHVIQSIEMCLLVCLVSLGVVGLVSLKDDEKTRKHGCWRLM